MTALDMKAICADLEAEEEVLDSLVAGIDDSMWDTPTPAEGWTVRDQISHLAYSEELAALAATDPEAFIAQLGEIALNPDQVDEASIHRGRAMTPHSVLGWWRDARRHTLDALSRHDPQDRIPWGGAMMGAISFTTARLMETWAHGQDVADALGVARLPTDRLRHVAHLGVMTRGFSYTNRGMAVPQQDVRVELVAPSGEVWAWGAMEARDRIIGPALEFCLVVVQRRHPVDTDLEIDGPLAAEWMSIAQAYAGPPGAGRKPGQFPRASKGKR